MAMFCVCMTLVGRVHNAASAELQRMDLESMGRRNRNFAIFKSQECPQTKWVTSGKVTMDLTVTRMCQLPSSSPRPKGPLFGGEGTQL